jgi:hypothetical protein
MRHDKKAQQEIMALHDALYGKKKMSARQSR